MVFLSDYFLYFIKYDNENNLLNLFNGEIEYEIIDSKIFKTEEVNCGICEECGENICECKIKNFFKIDIYNEDVPIYQMCLHLYRKNNLHLTKQGFIVIKSTTITTHFNLDNVKSVLNDIPNDLDIFYFSKWLDKFETIETIKTYNNGSRLIKTFNPLGFQSVLLKNSFITKMECFNTKDVVCRPFSLIVLNKIKEGDLIAYSTFPTLFSFDPFSSKTFYKAGCYESVLYEYLKNCELQGTLYPEEPLTRRFSSDIIFFWIFIICIIVFICYYFFNK